MTYSVKEIFYTLQGEGSLVGTPAVFIRFAGCNLWSGRDEHRERDAERNGAKCPVFCDTDFVSGVALWSNQICDAVEGQAERPPLIVLTGGEPLLQVDAELIEALRFRFPGVRIAVETNGTTPLKKGVYVDHLCVSPKVPASELVLRSGTELKVVFPSYDPADYLELVPSFMHAFVSVEAETKAVGKSIVKAENMRSAAAWVMMHPRWRLSLQTHKLIGVP